MANSKTSGVDGRPLDGVHSVRIKQDADFESDGRTIACTEVNLLLFSFGLFTLTYYKVKGRMIQQHGSFQSNSVYATLEVLAVTQAGCLSRSSTNRRVLTAAWLRCCHPAVCFRKRWLWPPAVLWAHTWLSSPTVESTASLWGSPRRLTWYRTLCLMHVWCCFNEMVQNLPQRLHWSPSTLMLF